MEERYHLLTNPTRKEHMRAIDKRIEELAAKIASEEVCDDYERGYEEGKASARAIIDRLEAQLKLENSNDK